MSILVTGASGSLGKEIIKALRSRGLPAVPYSHKDNLSDIDWQSIDCVVNCAAVIPSAKATMERYLSGNVHFLQSLLPYCKDKLFVHFSTFSELYRHDNYQISKMLGNSVILSNTHLFSRFYILPLPTLEDTLLVKNIVESIRSGGDPVVDKVLYNYMSFSDVSNHVAKGLLDGIIPPISTQYKQKNLYDEVCRQLSSNIVVEGATFDRTMSNDGLFEVCPMLLSSMK